MVIPIIKRELRAAEDLTGGQWDDSVVWSEQDDRRSDL